MFHRYFLFLVFIAFCTNSFAATYWFVNETVWSTDTAASQIYWIGDFNGDGLSDKVRREGNGNWWVALSNGKSFDSENKWLENQGNNSTKQYIGDFNGDGMSDIIWLTGSGYWYAALATQVFNTTTGPIYKFNTPQNWGQNPFSATNYYVGDYNGDGIDDILVYQNVWMVITSNGYRFNPSRQWKYAESTSFDGAFIGDFNGDGLSDITIYRRSQSGPLCGETNSDVWTIALANSDSTFANFNCPGRSGEGGPGTGSQNFFGDLNGDGKADKINYYSRGDCYVAESMYPNWPGFSVEDQRSSGQGINATAYIGDFNGDNLSELAYYYPSTKQWKVSLDTCQNLQQKIVAVWFGTFYKQGSDGNTYDGTDGHGVNKGTRDLQKTPIVGWGSGDSTITGYYNSNDTNVVLRQIDAMVKAGINLIIADNTNGWDLSGALYYREGLDTLFYVMKRRSAQGKPTIPIAISLGFEFWGPITMGAYHDRNNSADFLWNSWNTQYQKQEVVLIDIKRKYVDNFENGRFYFKYLGKPLIIAYLENAYDYPPRDVNGNNIPMRRHNNFTIIPAANWHATYGWYNPGVNAYQNGQETRKTWGWGSRWYPTHYLSALLKQPYNAECMSVMPGAYCWGHISPPPDDPDRDKGIYYIKSWENIIEAKPKITLIGGWNNWMEETCIEACTGTNRWKDYYNNYDSFYYLKITQKYSNIFRKDSLLKDTYIKEDNDNHVYYYSGGTNLSAIPGSYPANYPAYNPVILLPQGWLSNHGYSKSLKQIADMNNVFNYKLESYPNPFNPTTTINYELEQDGMVSLKIYDILGKEIKTLVNEPKEKGRYSTTFNGSDLASGVYLYRIQVNDFVSTKKLLLLK